MKTIVSIFVILENWLVGMSSQQFLVHSVTTLPTGTFKELFLNVLSFRFGELYLFAKKFTFS